MKFTTLYVTLLRTVSTKARLGGFVGVAAFQLVAASLLSSRGLRSPEWAAAGFVDVFGLSLVVPLAALVFGTASLGDPIEDGTYVYLWLRPIRRWMLTVTAFAVTLTLVVPLAVVPTVAAGLVVSPTGDLFTGAALATVVAALGYSAFFVLLGQVTQRSLIWGIAYLLILEQFVARGGSGLGALAVHSHAVSILAWSVDREMTTAYYGPRSAMAGAAVLTALFLAVSARRQSRMNVN